MKNKITIYLPDELYKKYKDLAPTTDIPELIRSFLAEELNKINIVRDQNLLISKSIV